MKSQFFNHNLNRRAGVRTLGTLTAGLALLVIIGWSWPGLRTALAGNPAGDYPERAGKWRSLAAMSAPLQYAQGVHSTATGINAANSDGVSFCPPLGPEINVKGNSVTIVRGDFTPDAGDGTDFGNVVANTDVVVHSFTIENTGTGELLLTGTPKVFLGGTDAADFSIALQPNSPVAGSTTFLVNFAPTATGVRRAGVTIANNDEDENPYFFTIQGTGTLPGAVCSNFGNKTTLSGLGSNFVRDVYAVDTTVYAATFSGLSISTNGGNFFTKTTDSGLGNNNVFGVFAADTEGYGRVVYAATFGGLSISTNGGNFFTNRTTVDGLGSNIVLDAYAVGLTVYAATNGGLAISTDGGVNFTNRTTANGLGNNIVYDVYVAGTTVYAATNGGLSISTNGGASFVNRTIANGLGSNVVYGVYAAGTTVYAATTGGLAISTDGGASFANRTTANGLGGNVVYGVYAVGATIYAATNGGLSISTSGGANFANYTTASGLGNNLVGGVYATATSIYAATDGGLSFCPPLPADINVRGNLLTIASGDQTPDAADGTDFGNAAASTNVVVHSFTIESTGTGELHLTGTPKVALGGPNAADFSIAMQPSSPVAGVTTFLVNFAPTATGVRTATVSIANNDPDENPYIFAIRGTGTPTPNGPVCTSFTNKGTGSGLGNNNVEAVHTVGSTVYAATEGGLSISTNGGTSFTNRTIANGLGSNTVYDVYAAGTTVYAATANGLAISTNGGASFTNRTTTSGLGSNAVRGVYAAGTMVYAATEGGLAISTNSGTSFTNRTTAHGLGHNFVFGVYAAGTTVYAATNGGGLAISTNGGTSFTNRTTISGLGSNVVRDTYVAGTTVYAATAGGLSISTDGGASFTNRTNTSGLSSVFGVHAAGTTVYAATFLGLMISTNGGVSFTSYTTANGLGNSFVRGVYATATSIYAATPGGLSFCPPPVPEINVRGNNVTIASGDTTPSTADYTDFGSTTANDGTLTRIFTIENTGSVNLNLTSTTMSGTDGIEFSFTPRPSSPVPSSGSTTFVITFRPRGGGTRTAQVYIESDDPDENPYTFTIQGTGLTPEINVKGNNTTIADGDSTPSTTNDTDFGAANIAGGTVMKTFTIENSGAGNLALTGAPRVGLSGTNAADFSVTTQPVSPVPATNGTTTFVVSFDPSALGTRTATVNIANNDENESPYTFTIQGMGATPEINVRGNNITIANNDTTPGTTDGTDFGAVNFAGGTAMKTFTIENIGPVALTLTGTPRVFLSGTHAADFSVTTQPASPVAATSGTTTFVITFDASALGTRTATVSIANNDADENPYTFAIQGTGDVPPTLSAYPNATVQAGASTIVTPSAAPANTVQMTAMASSGFQGSFVVDPVTGVVRITNAGPAGMYTVTVTAFSSTGVPAMASFPLTVTDPALCTNANFTGSTEVSVGTNPRSVAVGDFNGDGKLDFAAVNSFNNTVSIRLGDGAGNFSGSTNVSVEAGPFSVALGDFNGDGKLDFATSNFTNASVSIRLGDGAGNFNGATNVSVGTQPYAVTVGDFNGDGKLDFATSNFGGNTVSIRLGDGTGNFSGTTEVSVGAGPRSVALGDFNGDGKFDFAAANANSNTVSIRLGDGAGNFSGSTNVSVGSGPQSVAVGDFNGDGKLDFATANIDSNTVSIRLGDGAGSFSGTTNVSVGSSPLSVAVGDFNGDGKLDFAAANFASATVSIRLGNGAGAFSGTTNVSVGTQSSSVAVGDFDGDGKLDFAAANQGNSTVSIRLSDCTLAAPEMNVKGNNVTIANNDTTPSATDDTEFGAVNFVSGMVIKTFTIENTGLGALNLTGMPRVVLSGTHVADFSVTTQPASPVAATSGTTTFVVAFDPGVAELRTATISIANDDADENPYTFAIQGTGCSAPGISVPPQSQTVCEGSSVTFSVTATGNGLSYQWRKGGVDIPGATSAIYTIASALAGDAGSYDVIVTGICGSVTSSVATLTVNVCSPNNGLQFYPLAHPVRLLDTRAGQPGCDAPGAMIPGNTSRTQTAAGRTCDGLTIPANAKALTGNITTVESGGGFLTLFPSDITRPLVANSNFTANQILNNVFTVGLGAADGAFNIYVTTNTNVVVDITGYYAPPSASGLYFHSLPKPVRLLDTRTGATACFTPEALLAAGSTTTQLGTTTCDGVLIPAGAQALVGNATTVNPQANGFLTLFPADATRPLIASSNFQTGINMNAPFTVGLSPSGEFNIYTASTTDLVVDVLGYFSTQLNDSNGQGLLFNPLPTPVRLLDTRAGQTGCFTPEAQMNGGTAYLQSATGACTGIPATAKAVVGNATTVNVSANGFLTFWPSDATQPFVAASNYRSGTVFNRHFTVGLGTDTAFKRFTSSTTDLIIDISGFFAP